MLITDASKAKRYKINALIVKVNVQSINQSIKAHFVKLHKSRANRRRKSQELGNVDIKANCKWYTVC